jgi:nucleoside-diphosphate-sugar epimerase
MGKVMRATVFGARGFIGRHLVAYLTEKGCDVLALARGDHSWRGRELGHAFYCVGLTADFRSRPFETIDAHVGYLTEVLKGAEFSSFVYLSSTRVYARASSTDESSALPVLSADPDDLYNVSKLLGEAACLGSGLANTRIARLSNVFGDDFGSANFLTSVLREAVDTKLVHLRTSLESEKDYIWIGDVVRALEAIAIRGVDAVTNVAHGTNTTHREIMGALGAATGARVRVAPGAPTIRFPPISTKRLDRLIGCERTPLPAMIGALASAFTRQATAK